MKETLLNVGREVTSANVSFHTTIRAPGVTLTSTHAVSVECFGFIVYVPLCYACETVLSLYAHTEVKTTSLTGEIKLCYLQTSLMKLRLKSLPCTPIHISLYNNRYSMWNSIVNSKLRFQITIDK